MPSGHQSFGSERGDALRHVAVAGLVGAERLPYERRHVGLGRLVGAEGEDDARRRVEVMDAVPDRDRVHYLNPTAGVIFAMCADEPAEPDLPTLVREALGSDEPGDRDVAECVAKLRAEGLVA